MSVHVPARPEFPSPLPVVRTGRQGRPVRAVILVGGRGSRLAPLTDRVPKPLLPVGHVRLVEHTLARLAQAGVVDVTLALGFRPDDFVAAFPYGAVHGVSLRYVVEPEPLDTGGAVAFAVAQSGFDDTFVVCNGDVLDSVPVTALLDQHFGGDQLATLQLTRVEDPSRFGVVSTDQAGRVLGFVEKPAPGTVDCADVNAGTYVMEPAALESVVPGSRVSLERETFPLLASRQVLSAFVFDGYWLDAGKPDSYLQANRDMVELVGAVHPDAVVDPSARLVGSVVGSGARVDAGAVLVDSVVLDGAVVGSGSVLVSCVVGLQVRVGPHSVVSGALLA